MAKPALLAWLGLLLQLTAVLSQWQTSGPDYYDESCPGALDIIHELTQTAFAWDRKVAAELLRMSFHDCAVNGCDAGLLLDDRAKQTELYAAPNGGLAGSKGVQLMDEIKAVLDKKCGPKVSCSDILSVAVRDATVFIGGPSWRVTLGRLDVSGSKISVPGKWLPGPRNLVDRGQMPLLRTFERFGLDARDLVALSGAHSVGDVGCGAFADRRLSQPRPPPHGIDEHFRSFLQQSTCKTQDPEEEASMTWRERGGTFHLANTTFNNLYFINLTKKKGVLTSDQALFEHSTTRATVQRYAADRNRFFNAFAAAMVKMKELKPDSTNHESYGQSVTYGIRVGSCTFPEKVV